jgi:hypothetical protein
MRCQLCGTDLQMGNDEMPPVPVEVAFGTKIDRWRFPTDYMDSPNAEVHTLDRCRWQSALNKVHALEKLVVEIAHHFDPMFGHIDLGRLDDREWMAKAAKAVGEDAIYPWKKADAEAAEKERKKR